MYTTQSQANQLWTLAEMHWDEKFKQFVVEKTSAPIAFYARVGDTFQTKVVNDGEVKNESSLKTIEDDGVKRVFIKSPLFIDGKFTGEYNQYPIPEEEFKSGRYILPEGYIQKLTSLIQKEKSMKIKFKMMDILERK